MALGGRGTLDRAGPSGAGHLGLDGATGAAELLSADRGGQRGGRAYAWDPRLLVGLWVYAYSRGVSSAREIARRCTYEPAFQWLCGMEAINHHTLSDFRVAHGPALEELFVELLGVLSHEGLVSLERVMHDGTKVKAFASGDSFRREDKLRAHLAAARQQVEALSQNSSEEPSGAEAAQQRAARERQQRVEQALEQLEQVRQAKRSAKEKEEARVSLSDPTARVMKQADGGFAPSYNVQVSTEASHKIIVAAAVKRVQCSSLGALLKCFPLRAAVCAHSGV